LFAAYARSLPVDLAYQDFDAELSALPGKYAAPGGALLLGLNEQGRAIGCVAVRPLGHRVCEMKRLYVAPGGRGSGAGRRLAQAAIAVARGIGYGELRLDTLPSMTAAQALYRSLGFVSTESYYDTPIKGTVFLSLAL
jgi:ribosomal protein S18 acetylase RimI-like enzyme